jgi:hypothetical protein
MTKIIRKKIKKKTSPPTPKVKVEEIIEEEIPEVESIWKEDIKSDSATTTRLKNKFCKLCIKLNTCVIVRIAHVMTCDKIEIKKKKLRLK